MRTLPPENFHLVQTTAQRYRITSVDRPQRRAAMSAIYTELGVGSLRQRLMTLRRIIKTLSSYHFESGQLFSGKGTDSEAWFDGVAEHADALGDLIRRHPEDFGAFVLVRDEDRADQVQNAHDMLSGWANMARHYRTLVPKRAGRPKRNMGMIILIDRLRTLYQAATGLAPGRSTEPISGRPTGPFVRFLRGVCELGGINMSDEAIAKAIRDWQLWSKHINTERI